MDRRTFAAILQFQKRKQEPRPPADGQILMTADNKQFITADNEIFIAR